MPASCHKLWGNFEVPSSLPVHPTQSLIAVAIAPTPGDIRGGGCQSKTDCPREAQAHLIAEGRPRPRTFMVLKLRSSTCLSHISPQNVWEGAASSNTIIWPVLFLAQPGNCVVEAAGVS